MDEFLDKKCLNKCCFIIPIVPGAFIIVLCHVITIIYKSHHISLMSTWVFWFYVVTGVLYLPFVLAFLIGIFKGNRQCLHCFLVYYGFVMLGFDIIVLGVEVFRITHGRKVFDRESDMVVYLMVSVADVIFAIYVIFVCYSAYKQIEEDCNRRQGISYI